MEPFHAFLTVQCRHCQAPLLRLGLSENNDIVICPVCLKAGGFDMVLEEGAELSALYECPDEAKDLARRLWAGHTPH